MNDIEKSKYAIRVENWSGNMEGGDARNNSSRKRLLSDGETEQRRISVRVEIAAINFKNE